MEADELQKMTRRELTELAKKAGISVSPGTRKQDIIRLLNKGARAVQPAREPSGAAGRAAPEKARAEAARRQPLPAGPARGEPAAPRRRMPAAPPARAEEKPAPAAAPKAVEKAGPPPVPVTGRRVAVFAWESTHGLADGDVASYVTQSAGALRRAGDDVHVFTRGEEGTVRTIDGVRYHFCGAPSSPDILADSAEFCAKAAAEWRREHARGGPFQVAHGYEWLSAGAVKLCREDGAERTVITFHSSEYERAGGRFEGGLSKAIRDAERDATHAADRVVAVSDDLRQQLLWLYELPSEKVVVVHTGIGLHPGEPLPDVAAAKAARGIGPADPVFIFIGDLTPETGPDLLISAVPRIVGASPSVHFVFVGEGPLRAGLLQRASDLGVARNVHFTGRIADDELWQLLSASDAAIFPCRSPRPLGSVLLAWSAGKPVIATHTGPAELVWHDVTGLKVYPHEASLAWGIERLLHDPEFGRWMGRNGRVAVDEAFTWDAVARKLHGVYSH